MTKNILASLAIFGIGAFFAVIIAPRIDGTWSYSLAFWAGCASQAVFNRLKF